jgi:hypothetical protein
MAQKNSKRPSQPVDLIVWRHVDDLKANNYNPNVVAPPELELIKVSILEDGWTAAIVITDDFEIVDGYHRWLCTKTDLRVYARTAGQVPTVTIRPRDAASKMMGNDSTQPGARDPHSFGYVENHPDNGRDREATYGRNL